jgi:hypothetical protein
MAMMPEVEYASVTPSGLVKEFVQAGREKRVAPISTTFISVCISGTFIAQSYAFRFTHNIPLGGVLRDVVAAYVPVYKNNEYCFLRA